MHSTKSVTVQDSRSSKANSETINNKLKSKPLEDVPEKPKRVEEPDLLSHAKKTFWDQENNIFIN